MLRVFPRKIGYLKKFAVQLQIWHMWVWTWLLWVFPLVGHRVTAYSRGWENTPVWPFPASPRYAQTLLLPAGSASDGLPGWAGQPGSAPRFQYAAASPGSAQIPSDIFFSNYWYVYHDPWPKERSQEYVSDSSRTLNMTFFSDMTTVSALRAVNVVLLQWRQGAVQILPFEIRAWTAELTHLNFPIKGREEGLLGQFLKTGSTSTYTGIPRRHCRFGSRPLQ